MSNPELVRVMDYILNRCDEQAIDAVAAAVVRRRRELAMFGGAANLPDAKKTARDLSGRINAGASIEGMRETVRDMAVRIIRREAPELTDEQIAELTDAWIPRGGRELPAELLLEMVDQFVGFSTGSMSAAEDKKLRDEMGAWPERYWKAFPGAVKMIVKDYLNGEINEKAYRSKVAAALSFGE
ncbi:MAG: hypothetical protein LBC31_12025 [Treponema sp.]|jgi:hypothetical protein|nr:hypothetical protein [Treponema sp.]